MPALSYRLLLRQPDRSLKVNRQKEGEPIEAWLNDQLEKATINK